MKLVYSEGVDPTTLIALRMLFSVPLYIVVLLWTLRKSERRETLSLSLTIRIAVAGLFGYYAASFLDLIGLQYVTAQLGRMILYTYPGFVVILGALLMNKKVTPQIILSLLITYSGVVVIFGHDLIELGPDVLKGAAFVIASAASFSIYLLLSNTLIQKVGSQLFTCLALISASIGIFLHYAVTYSFVMPSLSQNAFWLILAIAIFCTVIPSFFTTAAVGIIGAAKVSIVAMVGPIFTSIFAVALLTEAFTVFHAIGILITMVGLWILQKS